MSKTVTVPVEGVCQHKYCRETGEYAYVVTGEFGEDGVAVYCTQHSEQWADESESHSAIAEVDR
jgi:hypothetical protein